MSTFPPGTGADLFACLLELLDDGVLLHAPDGRVRACNDSALRILGLERGQAEGLRGLLNALEAVNEDGVLVTPDSEPARVALRSGAATRPVRVRIRRPDGVAAWLLLRSAPLRVSGGARGLAAATTGAVTLVRDLTERVLLEQRLKGHVPEDAFSRLAGSVAHDFNHQLTVILGHTEVLHEHLEGRDDLREYTGEVRDAAVRASRLTDELLDFSRRQRRAAGIMDLHRTVSAMVPMLARLLGPQIRLRTEFGRESLWVRANAAQMERVVLNLVLNARDAMPEGGELRLSLACSDADEKFLRAHPGAQPGPYVRLAIADTGSGLTPEARLRLYEPFFTTKPPGQGTGLGLSTVYAIVKQFGGTIDVHSEPGRGTEFRIGLRSYPPGPRPEPGPDLVGRSRTTAAR